MNSSKQITVTALLLFIIGSLSGNAIGQRLGGDDEKTETLVLGTLAFVGLVVYDIATAPSSAKHYNEGLRDMFPLIEDRRFVGSGAYTFGQPGFSRAALVKDNSQAIFCELQKSNKKEKSPTTALLWSLGATVIPSAVGLGVVASRNWDFTTYWVVITSALVFGPSAGHFYSGKVVRGVLTSVLRIGFGVLSFYAINWNTGG